ncbi:MAG: hypothetical protein ABEK59_13435 [Halobacteria archaeon]
MDSSPTWEKFGCGWVGDVDGVIDLIEGREVLELGSLAHELKRDIWEDRVFYGDRYESHGVVDVELSECSADDLPLEGDGKHEPVNLRLRYGNGLDCFSDDLRKARDVIDQLEVVSIESVPMGKTTAYTDLLLLSGLRTCCNVPHVSVSTGSFDGKLIQSALEFGVDEIVVTGKTEFEPGVAIREVGFDPVEVESDSYLQGGEGFHYGGGGVDG